MNRENLAKLSSALRATPREQFDQRSWHTCTAHVAAKMLGLYGTRGFSYDSAEVAKVLGISRNSSIFYVSHIRRYIKETRNIQGEMSGKDITPDMVADYIDAILRGEITDRDVHDPN